MDKIEKEIIDNQIMQNKKLADTLKKYGVVKLKMTSLGNSIATGYSMVRTIKPLLLRNASLEKILNKQNILLKRNHFARAQNNNDEATFNWLQNNITQSEINQMVRSDFGMKKDTRFRRNSDNINNAINQNTTSSMKTRGLTASMIEQYYPTYIKGDLGLKDEIFENHPHLANIVVYNGGTGSFLDLWTRENKKSIFGKIICSYACVKRDITSIEATLKQIQNNNRENGSNTQVYICGAPNPLGFAATPINRSLQKIAKRYANTTYVKPLTISLIYDKYDPEEQEKLKKGFDFHYSELEYLEFNTNIIEEINNNYGIIQASINLDRNLHSASRYLELLSQDQIKDKAAINDIMNRSFEKAINSIKTIGEKRRFLIRIKEYLLYRAPFDFFYLGSSNQMEDSIENQKVKNNLY